MIHSSLYLTKKHKATKGFPTKDIRKHTALPFWNPSLKGLGGHMKRNYNDDLLFFLLEYSKISIEDAKSEIEKMTNRKYLEQHSFDIWQGTDTRWRTYLPDDTKKNKRRLIAKSTKEKIEAEIITYYKGLAENVSLKKITLRTFYQTWLDYKKLKTTSSMYIRRIHSDWENYYLNDAIIDIPLVKLDYDTLEEWALKKIRENQLTKKSYYNLSIILRGSLDLACQKGIITENPFQKVKIDYKLFFRKRKPDDATQVFLTNEQPEIEREAYEDFQQTENVACLAIPLLFQTGLRLGEIVAIKSTDISGNYLHVQRMEIRTTKQLPDGSWATQRFEIVEHTKSEAGNRNVYLTSTAKKIIQQIELCNQEHGYKDNDFLFLNADGRIHSKSIDTRIRKYCRHIGIAEKGCHKARKTNISLLIDGRVNINRIREQVGHASERTTYNNYCFNRMTNSETENLFEKALVNK